MRIWLIPAAISVMYAAALPNPVEINPGEVARGGTFFIRVGGAPAASSAAVTLIRNGVAADAVITNFDGKATGGPVITATAPGADTDLGTYEVQILLDKKAIYRSSLRIRPAGSAEIKLAEFDTAYTYDTEQVWTQTPSEKDIVEQRKLRYLTATTSDLAGAIPAVLVDGKSVAVEWTGCENLPSATRDHSVVHPARIYGSLKAGNTIELCRVPAGSVAFANSSAKPVEDPDKAEIVTVRIPSGATAVRTVALKLRGSGFVRTPPSDNSIWINGERQPIVWDSCSPPPPAGTSTAPVDGRIHGQVIGSEQIALCHVPVPQDGTLLVAAGYGDTQSETRSFTVYSMGKGAVAFWSVLITAVLGFVVACLIWWVNRPYEIVNRDGKRKRYRLRVLLLDPETNTYSLSKFQFYLWTGAALFAYAYLYISKVVVQHLSWPDIPASLPGIVGIGAGTAIGSQVVTATLGSKGAGAEVPGTTDFLTSGGVAAPDRVQMFLWTLFGVGAFCMAVLQLGPGTIREIPPVPEGMLYMMGLSAAGYLGGKLARKAGPVLNEISVDPPDSDDGIAKAALAAGSDLPELAQAAVPAQNALAALPAAMNAKAKEAVEALKSAIQATTSAKTTSEVTQLVTTIGELRTKAENAADQAVPDFDKNPAAINDAVAMKDAQTAQQAASALQDLSAAILSAISIAAIPSMEASEGSRSVARTIELRGTNLSPEGMFEIEHTELPFRMLSNSGGQHAPEVLVRQDGGTSAKVIRLSINPAKLASTDLALYQKWFSGDGRRLLTVTNPDGQKAELSFTIPPAAVQKAGS